MLNEIALSEINALFQVVVIDLVLAGDNAIVVGMAAAGVVADQRRRVIFWGILIAVVLRILFASITLQLLAIIGLTLAGGLLLLWVCWKFYRELTAQSAEDAAAVSLEAGNRTQNGDVPTKSMRSAVWQVALADVSMSLDNVLAVAGAAGDHMSALVIGLALSVLLMGVAASLIAGILQRHH